MVLKFQTGIDLLTVFNYMYTVVINKLSLCVIKEIKSILY